MWFVCTLVVMLIGCGRFGFEPAGGGSNGGDGDGGTRGDSRDPTIDGANDRPNVVFMTSTGYTGALGGLAGADAECAAAATSGGLPGTFVAFLSTADEFAFDRLAGSRGWVRTDGVPVADTVAGLKAGAAFNPIDRDERGERATGLLAWSGTTTIGVAEFTCGGWTLSSGYGIHGVRAGALGEMLFGGYTYITTCADPKALYCFEIGHDVPVEPVVEPGARVAFIATPAMHGAGVDGLDTQCRTEAAQAGLAGTYRAAVAVPGASIASRFPGGPTWARRDGTAVAASAPAMFDGTMPLSFINQRADGSYDASAQVVRTGAMPQVQGMSNDTCNGWNSTSNTVGQGGSKIARSDLMWLDTGFSCMTAATTYCLQM